MNINVLYRPSMSLAQVQLNAGESITAEAGAMVGMSTNIHMETQATGGAGGGLKRMLARESFFQNMFTAQNGPGEVLLSQDLPGDIVNIDVPQTGLNIQSSSYIASMPGVTVTTEMGGLKNFFGGEGLFVLKAAASGPNQSVVVGAFGGIEKIPCNGTIVIDNGHLVAWETTLEHKLVKSGGGFISSMLSGEGLVFQFTGTGNIWIQTRNPAAWGQALSQYLPPI